MHLLSISNLASSAFGPVDLNVDRNETVCISGRSGSGKSRLLRSIADMDPHQGQMSLGSVSSDEIAAHDWRSQVGLLPAESAWWSDYVDDHFEDAGTEQLQLLGFGTDVLRLPVSQLSSGERQRLALLRLLSCNPRVLLLDEPSANLDASNTRLVEQFITEYQQQTSAAIIWVSHDMAQISRVATRHFVMDNGKLAPDA